MSPETSNGWFLLVLGKQSDEVEILTPAEKWTVSLFCSSVYFVLLVVSQFCNMTH